jgi:hypothetical protein
MPDDGTLVDALGRLVPDPSLLRKVLVDNPGRLLNLGIPGKPCDTRNSLR